MRIEPSLSVVSYNILATAYIRPEWYPETPKHLLDPAVRLPALSARLREFTADVVCLQEVEPSAFEALERYLGEQGYRGCYARKGLNKPDGCATFYRPQSVRYCSEQTLYYHDGDDELDSGHLALITEFETESGTLKVANTHLKWGETGKPPGLHLGFREISELLDALPLAAGSPIACIVCGDFNAEPNSPLLDLCRRHALHDAYAAQPQNTCNSNRRAKRIDYLLHTPNLIAAPKPIRVIGDATPLPSSDEPSDHLAIAAVFTPAPQNF